MKKSPAQLQREIDAALMSDETKLAIRGLRDLEAQQPGIIAACNAVLGGTADRATRRRILDVVARSRAVRGMEPGLRAVARRSLDAEERFLAYAMEHGRLDRDQALAALAAFRKVRAIKLDAVNGTFQVKHGALLEPDVLRRAAGVEE